MYTQGEFWQIEINLAKFTILQYFKIIILLLISNLFNIILGETMKRLLLSLFFVGSICLAGSGYDQFKQVKGTCLTTLENLHKKNDLGITEFNQEVEKLFVILTLKVSNLMFMLAITGQLNKFKLDQINKSIKSFIHNSEMKLPTIKCFSKNQQFNFCRQLLSDLFGQLEPIFKNI